MLVFLSSLLLFAVLTLVGQYWHPLYPDPAKSRRALFGWTARGLAVPVLLWTFFNLGIWASLPPLWPAVGRMPLLAKGYTFSGTLVLMLAGFHMIGWCWLAVTFGWMTALVAWRTSNRGDFAVLAGAISLLVLPIALTIAYSGGIIFSGLAAALWLLPILHFTISDAKVRKVVPMYSRAIARMKFGRYADAEMEVIQQLEKCESDFNGWMMLAELYAERFGDLAQADRTIRDLCDQPGMKTMEISVALNRLADWHLHLGGDPDRACATLAEICRRLPGSHSDHMAKQRIGRLPVTREELEQQARGVRLALPPRAARFDATGPVGIQLSRADAAALANDLVAQLTKDPNNAVIREKLAILLADQAGRPDLAIEQLQLLIEIPDAPERSVAKWLGLIASWHVRHCADEAAARGVYERLVRDFPHSPEAFEAQRRLSLIAVEERFKRAAAYRESVRPVVE